MSETIKKKMTMQPIEWKKIFADDISDKALMSKICKNDTKLNRKEQKNPIKKWAEDQNRYFFQRRYTNGQQAHEKDAQNC